MINPLSNNAAAVVRTLAAQDAAAGSPAAGASGDAFSSMLRSQLERVSAMQSEADQGVQRVLTGQSENIGEVFVAARKAEIAFGLLMEMRNKLIDAYEELRQLRV